MTTYLERRYSKPEYSVSIELPSKDIETIPISWNLINESSQNYAELLQDYDISEIIKSFIQRYKRSKNFGVFTKPGNLDIKDKYVNFHDFYAELEDIKEKYKNDLSKASNEEINILKEKCNPIINYFITGEHPNKDKVFKGWSSILTSTRKTKKTLLLGIISIDLPTYVSHKKYKCSGTQHYVAFLLDLKINKLYIFDSASKNPSKDNSEIYYILKYTFEKILDIELNVEGLVFRNILQPGAGDQKEEDQRSYNNQNVFCHTWSLWFSLVMICFYNTDEEEKAMKFIRSLSHRNQMLNLAMIKRFAGWITLFLDEGERINADKKFAERAYLRAKEKNDQKRLIEVLETYILAKDPYVGINYIFAYKDEKYISIDWVCRSRSVKMDVDLLDYIDELNINSYIEKSKEIRCPNGWELNEQTKRCKKIR